jgi:hypothetical protein
MSNIERTGADPDANGEREVTSSGQPSRDEEPAPLRQTVEHRPPSADER